MKESLLLGTESLKGIIGCGINRSLRMNSLPGWARGFLQSIDPSKCRYKFKALTHKGIDFIGKQKLTC
jgi:hypothetical protein